MRVALVHDYLTQNGGGEQVLAQYMRLFPEAPIFTLVYDRDVMEPIFHDADIRPSFLQRLPGGVRHYQLYLPLMPMAIESFDLGQFDVVLSSASSFAKGVLTSPGTTHICYCHTPTRYLWSDTHDYIGKVRYPWPLKQAARALLPRLRVWDRLAADRPDHMVTNSYAVQKRIQKYYHRAADVIYPPVDIDAFPLGMGERTYYVAGGRLVNYKRFDLVLRAFRRLKLPLKIFGVGPELARLRRMASSNVEFVGYVSRRDLSTLYQGARAYIHPQEEDFGITAVEAMASGTPVIAFGRGGAAETVVDGKTGIHIKEQDWEAIGDAVLRLRDGESMSQACRARASQFSIPIFQENIRRLVDRATTTADAHAHD